MTLSRRQNESQFSQNKYAKNYNKDRVKMVEISFGSRNSDIQKAIGTVYGENERKKKHKTFILHTVQSAFTVVNTTPSFLFMIMKKDKSSI